MPLPARRLGWKLVQTWSFRGSTSHNKVSVGEPAEGSFLSCVASNRRLYTHVNYTEPREKGRTQTVVLLLYTTLGNGSLGSPIDEERSESRKVV